MAPKKPTDEEFRFRIDAFSPDTIPMARLAEYMSEIAAVLGEKPSVHFRRLEAGSTIIVHQIEKEALPKVRERARAVRRMEGPVDALKAYKAVNKLLREDNAVGTLQEKKGVIIQFPGRDAIEEKYPPIRQHGTLDGRIVSVGGADNTVHVRLLIEGEVISGCQTTNRALGKELAQQFDEFVRLNGVGSWSRNSDGKWLMESFRIDSFEPLKNLSLSDALNELRGGGIDFDPGAYDDLQTTRHGPPRKTNGSH
ncbi:hypothetical protein ELH53_15260 [Rhizobium ruizarguesonis]|uniref:hypothetical protein n=1 Tax=Rhizobium ruizarguesonis TaxID=2081791 RepID=UPI0010314B0E|nr:hypothetical protein [Rhizobium ruizarguesonis]TBA86277.1 hypothetical protein ELH53_15260 [Rhizobium ruizarguesonis]